MPMDAASLEAKRQKENVGLLAHRDKVFTIKVKLLSEMIIDLGVGETDTLSLVKAKISQVTNGLAQPDTYRMVFAGQQLELERTLDQYDIEQGSLVYCIEEAPKWLQATQSQQ